MKNRYIVIPIVSAVALALAVAPGRSQATSANATTTAPTLSGATTTAPAAKKSAVASASASVPVTAPAKKNSTASATTPASAHTMPYTVLKGDTLTKLADKFNTTRKQLTTLNNFTATKLTPGQVILVPGSAKKSASTAAAKAKHAYLAAQPVQDFDIPASTFASCPVPVASGNEDDSEMMTPDGKPAPVAQLVSPAEMSADEKKQQQHDDDQRLTPTIAPPRLSLPPEARLAPMPKLAPSLTSISPAAAKPKTLAKTAPTKPAPSGLVNESRLTQASEPTQPTSFSRFWSNLNTPRLTSQSGMNAPANDPGNQWGFKFLKQARALGDRGIDYDDGWRPPGERSSWVMDCSNTTRYLYKSVTGINLPRTASDQYYYLHLQGKAWDVPTGPTGWADVNFLQRNLKPGDLLFWENTYRPERQPPITHVMVFLGTNERGQWIMAGSQSSRGGEHNRNNGGPDVYVFRPSQACGGYTAWFVHHQGRFCAFGRPLEADPSKFALND